MVLMRADLRNVCTEAGMFAIRDDRDFVTQDGTSPSRASTYPDCMFVYLLIVRVTVII